MYTAEEVGSAQGDRGRSIASIKKKSPSYKKAPPKEGLIFICSIMGDG
jgi:hypothetical protein